MKGPGLFSDIGKKAKDLLNKDYTADQKLSISTNTASGVGLTSTAVKKGGLYNFEVGSLYKYKNTLVDLKVDTDSNISTTFTISEILPYTKTIASFKLPDYNSGKLEMQYFHDHASLAAVIALKQSPVVELSTTVGAHGMALGAEAAYDTSSGAFTKYTAGIGFNQRDYNASIIFADKGDTLKAAYVHHLDEKQKSSVVAEIVRQFSTNQNTFTVGGVYAIDPLTTVKAKLNNNGKIAALIQHNLITTTVTISSEFDTKALERTPKFGLALALKP